MRGFTLVEMLVVITISAILVAAAIPSFQWLIARNRVADASNTLMSSLQLARIEAARRGATVVACRVDDANATPPVCSSVATGGFDGNDWAAGWVVFAKVDPSVNNSAFETNDVLIRRYQALGGNGAGVRVNAHANFGGAQRVAYPPFATAGMGPGATFALDYREPDTPAVNDRAFGSFTVTAAGRCMAVAAIIGTLRPFAPTAGAC
jgi:prepilin-type N-terminal cleavage/methylation domain-containing protein